MKHEDYVAQMNLIEEEARKVRSKTLQLKNDYIKELPFGVGDKVELEGCIVGWIASIQVSNSGLFDIGYYPPKKNGEMSQQIRRSWFLSLKDIKLIERGA